MTRIDLRPNIPPFGPGLYRLDGRTAVPCDDAGTLVWARWFEGSYDERRVAETFVGAARVSTVFLGIDHNFLKKGPPLLFETMIFGGPLDQYQERFSTWEEAEAGHAVAVAQARARESEVAP